MVIIGLIVGGVLVGKDLMEIAQTRRFMSQMEQFQLAANTFRLKYNCKAGDCVNASSLGLGMSGNGDGLLGGRYGSGTYNEPGCLVGDPWGCSTDRAGTVWRIYRSIGEHQRLFVHLSAAGLIKDSIVTNTSNAGVAIETTYPRDALRRNYVLAAGWNNKVHIKTGLKSLTSDTGMHVQDTGGTFSASEVQAIYNKLGYPIIGSHTSGYPDAIAAGHKVVLSGTADVFYSAPDSGTAPCVVSDGFGGYRFNISGAGRCDLIWELDW